MTDTLREKKKAVVLLSGGIDSTTLAYEYAAHGYQVCPISISYGQRHVCELVAAQTIAFRLDAPLIPLDLTPVGAILTSTLLRQSSTPVPHGHYADDNMKLTIVPNRNAILLSIASGYAVSIGADIVGFGAHAGDHAIYPDCRAEFVEVFHLAMRKANEGFHTEAFRVEAPFINMTKAEIVAYGAVLGVPYELTWSCYEGKRNHCGKCGTCVERKEAFALAHVPDPTVYEGE